MEATRKPPVVLVDDDPAFLLAASTTLRAAGVGPVVTVEDSREALPLLRRSPHGLVILDLTMPHLSGMELLGKVKEELPDLPVIILTAVDELGTAVEAMKGGADDYLVKPVEPSRFVSCVKNALERTELRDEVASLKGVLLEGHPVAQGAFEGILTINPAMLAVFRYLEAIASSPQPVLITGETGVGKELIARAVHRLSGIKGAFVDVSIAGLDDAMFSDTLFGHLKGAYTGADKPREGLMRRAQGGTIFLDEIGDLATPSQVKLLRLLQERSYYPLGSDIPTLTDARVIVATHRNLRDAVREGSFRNDLYYRLHFHHVHIPPLRERREDIPLLLDHFLGEAAASLGKRKPTPPRELFLLLGTHGFPGNIRELQSMVFDAVARHPGGILSLESFRQAMGAGEGGPPRQSQEFPRSSFGEEGFLDRFPTLEEADGFLVEEALRRAGGNQRIAAELLGITRQALNKRIGRKRARLKEK